MLAMALIAGTWMTRAADVSSSHVNDTDVAQLNEQVRSGRTQLRFEGRSGYLRSVLDHLHVPLESQVVTFSQASLHGPDVTDSYPRAIFFSDDVYVAWAPLSPTLEVAASSRQRGLVFYTLDQSRNEAPRFQERGECLACHRSERTLGVPGLFVLSAPRKAAAGPFVTDHRTPLSHRWGAWYVTGLSRRWKHQGNRIGQGWLTSLHDQFDPTGYPTLYSDIVALMVLEHQTRASNLMARARLSFETKATRLDAVVASQVLADYLLFADEALIPEAIVGTSGFKEWFSSRDPRDPFGRSLFQLDLKRRLFRYRVSYMIYSTQFDALPRPVKHVVYARVLARLRAHGQDDRHSDERVTLDILAATKPDFHDFIQGLVALQ
jgi:hypothetical protein